MFGCGYGSPDLTKVSGPGAVGSKDAVAFAVLFKMDLDGNLLRFYQVGNAVNSPLPAGGTGPRDTCRAIAYDSTRREVVAILEVTSPTLRTTHKPDVPGKTAIDQISDTLILTMDDSGGLKKAYAINYGESRIST